MPPLARAACRSWRRRAFDRGRPTWRLPRPTPSRRSSLNAGLAEAHVVLGQVAFQLDWDWEGAENAYQRALAFGPSYDFAWQCYSHFLAARGQVDRALRRIGRGSTIEPALQYQRSRARPAPPVCAAVSGSRDSGAGGPGSRSQSLSQCTRSSDASSAATGRLRRGDRAVSEASRLGDRQKPLRRGRDRECACRRRTVRRSASDPRRPDRAIQSRKRFRPSCSRWSTPGSAGSMTPSGIWTRPSVSSRVVFSG